MISNWSRFSVLATLALVLISIPFSSADSDDAPNALLTGPFKVFNFDSFSQMVFPPPPTPPESAPITLGAPPDEITADTIDSWLRKTLQDTTAVLIVWNERPYDNDKANSILQEVEDRTLELIVDRLADQFSSRPEGPILDLLREKVRQIVRQSERHLRSIGQAQIHGVPRFIANTVVDILQDEYKNSVKVAELDSVVQIADTSSSSNQMSIL